VTGGELPFSGTAEQNSLFESTWSFENDFESTFKEHFSGILTRQLVSIEMVPFLRGAMRAIASLGCEGAMHATASSMLPHAFPRQSPTPIFCAATADGITTVQTYVSAAMKTLPTTPTHER
jgi:hypothetical protein